jgi:hypothetical protein
LLALASPLLKLAGKPLWDLAIVATVHDHQHFSLSGSSGFCFLLDFSRTMSEFRRDQKEPQLFNEISTKVGQIYFEEKKYLRRQIKILRSIKVPDEILCLVKCRLRNKVKQ